MPSRAILPILCLSLLPFSLSAQNRPPAAADPFERGMREAMTAYREGRDEEVTGKLRELLALMEERGAAKVADLLPPNLAGWRGEEPARDDLATVGGGVSITRDYLSGQKRVELRVVKDSPLARQLMPLLANPDLLRLSNRKTHRVSGETAVMDGERKLQMVLDGRIFLELSGNEHVGERDLLTLARALDLRALSRLE